MGGPGLDGNVDRLRYSDLRLPSNAVIDFGNIGSAGKRRTAKLERGSGTGRVHVSP